jgi:hypothetical protein
MWARHAPLSGKDLRPGTPPELTMLTRAGDARAPTREQSQDEPRVAQWTIPIDRTAPGIARGYLAEVAGTLASGVLSHAQLLVSELVSHRVRLATDERRGELGLDIALTPRYLRVQLTDNDPRPSRARPDPSEPVLGWELQVVAELSDRWGMRHDTRTTLWWELDL